MATMLEVRSCCCCSTFQFQDSGSGLISTIGLLAGQFHLSVRTIRSYLQEQWQLGFSTGAISQAQGKMNYWLGPVYRHIGDHVRQAEQ